jgi:signal transduction histidine kinase
MANLDRIERMILGSRRLAWGVMALALLVLGGVIVLTTRLVRDGIRTQITGRDAAVLHAVLQTQLEESDDLDWGDDTEGPWRDLTAVLVTSRLTGVLGFRLFDVEGRHLLSFPETVREAELGVEDLGRAWELRPGTRWLDGVTVGELFYDPVASGLGVAREVFPILVVNVPLHTAGEIEPRGVAQFLIEGQTLADELGRLDRHLAYQAGMVFLVAGVILVGSLGWAYGRLMRSQESLRERTAALQRANEELARTARTTAVGAVTAHLIHGLKSPLAGLQSFVSAQGRGEGQGDPAEWETAFLSTRRMQTMISQTINVLREEGTGGGYDLTPGELVELVLRRAEPMARERGVKLWAQVSAEGRVASRAANLGMLILSNLVENAVQATRSGGVVRLEARRGGSGLEFEVSDEGPGVPEGVRADPFAPRRSSRSDGAGIGLAISKQLANHLGAELELRRSSEEGSVFALVLPEGALEPRREMQAG